MSTTTDTDLVQFKEPETVDVLRQRVRELAGQVPDQLVIGTHSEAQHATELLTAVKRVASDAEAERKQVTRPFVDEKRFLDETYKTVTAPLSQAERVIKAGILGYQREQDRLRQEEQRKALEAAAEQRKDAAAAAFLTGQEPSQEVLAPVVVPPPAPRTITTGVGQASVRKTWKVEVQDLRKLCEAIATGKAPIEAIAANEAFLRSCLMAQPEDQRAAFQVPGVRFYQEESVAAR